MYNSTDTLGIVLKTARVRSGLTAEAVAKKLGITVRYLYRIEKGSKKPSYTLLFDLIQIVSADANAIFYPGAFAVDSDIKTILDSQTENFLD